MKFPHIAKYPSQRSPVFSRNMVVASQPLATQAGLSMLARGGNAVDAALATAITLTVVEPTGNGVGSDAFCILWDGKELHGLNASGRSPAAWSQQRFASKSSMPFRGWESVTVPGAVSAWVALSDRFGKLPFATLFEPAIGHAENGFLVSPIIGELWRRGAKELKDIPGFAEMFMPGGSAPAPGTIFRSQALADTLRSIAASKGESFYRGDLAKKIADFAQLHGAAMTEEDLAAHKIDWCGTISQKFNGVSLHEIPPNGQGIATCMALGMLDATKLRDLDPDSAEATHLMLEAMKLAFADVDAYVADGDHMPDITTADLLNADYLAERAKLIDPSQAQNFHSGAPKHGGTVCLAAADESGMMVSYIQSNYAGFGSGVVVPGTGISLQNRGFGFNLTEGHPNCVGPSKRPFHTIIPGFVMKDGAPLMAFGFMGGPIQAQGHLQTVLRMQLWNQDPQMAADAPRWRFVAGRKTAFEESFNEDTLRQLQAMGHEVTREPVDESYGFGGAQIILRLQDGYVGGSDQRKDGHAAGF